MAKANAAWTAASCLNPRAILPLLTTTAVNSLINMNSLPTKNLTTQHDGRLPVKKRGGGWSEEADKVEEKGEEEEEEEEEEDQEEVEEEEEQQ